MSIRTPLDGPFERGNRIEGSPGTVVLGPVLHEARSGGLTYEPFYGLKEKPFSLTSDARFFYHSRSHAPAFDDLLAGIRRRESLNVLTGDIGTGKTTLCRAVLQNLDRKTFSAFVPDPFASREDLLKILLMDFGVVSVDDLTSGRLQSASRTELSYLLYEFLRTLAPLQAFAVVIIDEAQNLSVPLLEEIRILSDADGQLQVVLVGQLELRDKLKLPEMRQVDQRVSVHCSLAPLGCDGVAGYIAHRLQTAGGSPDRVRFSPEAIEAVYRVSGGVPRVINRLCDRALSQGYARRAGTIDLEMLEAALPEPIPPVPAAEHAAIPPSVAMAEPQQLPATVAPAPEPSSDPVDIWIAAVDRDLKSEGLGVDQFPSEVPGPEPLIPAPPPAVPYREPVAAANPTFQVRTHVQRTHMERTIRRWLRRLGTAALCVMTMMVVLVAAPSVLTLSADVWTAWTELLRPPVLPALPPDPTLSLAPALKLPRSTEAPELAAAGAKDGTAIDAAK